MADQQGEFMERVKQVIEATIEEKVEKVNGVLLESAHGWMYLRRKLQILRGTHPAALPLQKGPGLNLLVSRTLMREKASW
eukprot:12918031-Prorocentrum_lima.AAC.1